MLSHRETPLAKGSETTRKLQGFEVCIPLEMRNYPFSIESYSIDVFAPYVYVTSLCPFYPRSIDLFAFMGFAEWSFRGGASKLLP